MRQAPPPLPDDPFGLTELPGRPSFGDVDAPVAASPTEPSKLDHVKRQLGRLKDRKKRGEELERIAEQETLLSARPSAQFPAGAAAQTFEDDLSQYVIPLRPGVSLEEMLEAEQNDSLFSLYEQSRRRSVSAGNWGVRLAAAVMFFILFVQFQARPRFPYLREVLDTTREPTKLLLDLPGMTLQLAQIVDAMLGVAGPLFGFMALSFAIGEMLAGGLNRHVPRAAAGFVSCALVYAGFSAIGAGGYLIGVLFFATGGVAARLTERVVADPDDEVRSRLIKRWRDKVINKDDDADGRPDR